MRKLIPIYLLLAVLLAACIPVIGGGDIASLTAERSGDQVTATLTLNRESSDVLVLFTSAGWTESVRPGVLEPGVYTYSVTNLDPTSCSASGYAGRTYWLVYCTSE